MAKRRVISVSGRRVPVYSTLTATAFRAFDPKTQSAVINNEDIEAAKEWVDENRL